MKRWDMNPVSPGYKAYFTKGQIYQALYESPVADYKN